MKKILLYVFVFFMYLNVLIGQIAINNDGSSPESSAMLDITSSNKGILIPRMTEAERLNLNMPAEGLWVYQIDRVSGFYYFSNGRWNNFGKDPTFDYWLDNNYIYNGNTLMTIKDNGNVGIGTTTPSALLHVFSENNDAGILIETSSNDFINTSKIISRFARGAAGNLQSVHNNDVLSSLTFKGYNGQNYKYGGRMEFIVDEAPQTTLGFIPSRIEFYTNYDNTPQLVIKHNGKIGIGTSVPDSSAILEVFSEDKGLLLPRIEDTSFIDNPTAGLIIYDISSSCMRYYNGNSWSYCLEGIVTAMTAFKCGDNMLDPRDGQIYATVKIGNQCWMAENLNIGQFVDFGIAQSNNNIIEKHCYNHNINNCKKYGGLYKWDEAMQYDTIPGIQGICPAGWHIPTDDEWKSLEMNLGMSSSNANNIGWRGTDEGSKLAGGEPFWTNGALDLNTNFGTSGFNALPAGAMLNYMSYNLHNRAHFWTSNKSGINVWARILYYNHSNIYRNTLSSSLEFSVRCVKDE